MSAKSHNDRGDVMANMPADRIENLVDFDLADGEAQLISYTRFSVKNDIVVLQIADKRGKPQFVKYFLGLNEDLEVQLLSIESESKETQDGEVLRTGSEIFVPPRKLDEATEFVSKIKSALIRQIHEFDSEVNELVGAIKGENWKATRGHFGPDRQYAILAKLFVTLHRYNFESPVVKFAELLEITHETAKHRIRAAKEKGFLTTPGKGSTNTQLTDKAKDLTS